MKYQRVSLSPSFVSVLLITLKISIGKLLHYLFRGQYFSSSVRGGPLKVGVELFELAELLVVDVEFVFNIFAGAPITFIPNNIPRIAPTIISRTTAITAPINIFFLYHGTMFYFCSLLFVSSY